MRRKQGRIGRGVKLGEHSLVRIRRPRRVRAESDIQDRRVVWQARTAAQDFRKGQIVEPDKCQPVVKSPELVLELATPELAELSGPHHHEHLPGLGQQLQDVLDDARIVVDDRDSGLVVPKRGVTEIPSDRRTRTGVGVSGKSCCRYLRANTAAGPATVTIRSGLGRSTKVDRM